jgi:hypothetical protein
VCTPNVGFVPLSQNPFWQIQKFNITTPQLLFDNCTSFRGKIQEITFLKTFLAVIWPAWSSALSTWIHTSLTVGQPDRQSCTFWAISDKSGGSALLWSCLHALLMSVEQKLYPKIFWQFITYKDLLSFRACAYSFREKPIHTTNKPSRTSTPASQNCHFYF